jgi:hypothetical protein
MRYVLMVYVDEKKTAAMPPNEMGELMGGYMALEQELAAKKAKAAGEALQPIAAATSVRVRDGKTVVTDGPFAETKEQLGGLYVLDCKDLDEAIAWAAKVPDARNGTIEIRPIWDWKEAP